MRTGFLMNFWIILKQIYYKNNVELSSKRKPKFKGVYFGTNLTEIKDLACMINVDKCRWIATQG